MGTRVGYFNRTQDVNRPGRLGCGACHVECEGDNALEAVLLLITHVHAVKDEAHRKYAEWLGKEFAKSARKVFAR